MSLCQSSAAEPVIPYMPIMEKRGEWGSDISYIMARKHQIRCDDDVRFELTQHA